MPQRTCSCSPGCTRKVVARGLCDPAYRAAKRADSLPPVPPRRHTVETLMANVRKTADCWVWTGCISEQGYGRVHKGKAHRRIYEVLVGAIPAGMSLDHECHNRDESCPGGPTCMHRRCVNPAHLIPRPRGENALRSSRSTASLHAAKTHCPKRHAYTPENTMESTWNGRSTRRCRQCSRDSNRAAYSRRKEAAQ